MRFLAVARLCFCKQKLPQNAKSAMRISLFAPYFGVWNAKLVTAIFNETEL
jgi:hypothetical protein